MSVTTPQTSFAGENIGQTGPTCAFDTLTDDAIRSIIEAGYKDEALADFSPEMEPYSFYYEFGQHWFREAERRKFAFLVSQISRRLRRVACASPFAFSRIFNADE